MEPKFSKIVSSQMESAAKKAYPCECCGILVGKKSKRGEIEVTEIREASNQIQGEQETAHFSIDPLFLYNIERGLVYTILSVTAQGVMDVKSYTRDL